MPEITLEEMIKEMVMNDFEQTRRQTLLKAR
jgi:hypothetical protein